MLTMSKPRLQKKGAAYPCLFLIAEKMIAEKTLLRTRRVARHLCSRHVLRGGKISRDSIFVHAVHYHFKQCAVASGIKLQRLVDGAVFLLNLLVLGQHVQRKLALLGISLLKLQAHNREMRGSLVLLQRELKIIPVTAMLEHLQFVVRRGNQFTVLVQIADGMIQLPLVTAKSFFVSDTSALTFTTSPLTPLTSVVTAPICCLVVSSSAFRRVSVSCSLAWRYWASLINSLWFIPARSAKTLSEALSSVIFLACSA